MGSANLGIGRERGLNEVDAYIFTKQNISETLRQKLDFDAVALCFAVVAVIASWRGCIFQASQEEICDSTGLRELNEAVSYVFYGS